MPATAPAPAKKASTPVPTPIYRKQNPLTVANPIVKLTKTLVYRQLQLELTGGLTLLPANNTQANTGIGDEWAALQNLIIQANGSDVMRNFAGDDLYWLNYFWYGRGPQTIATLGDGATANPTFDSVLTVPFWHPRAFHPFDTLVDSGRFNDFTIQAIFNPFTSVNSAATGYASGPQISIVSHEQILPTDPGDQPRLNWVVKKLQNTPPGANSSFRVPLDAGLNYRRFIINIKNAAATADAGSTTFATLPQNLVSNVKVVGAGGRVYADEPWQNLVSPQRVETNSDLNPVRRSSASNSLAWGLIDLCKDGRLTESMPNPADAYLEFNVLGTCQINVLLDQLFPIAQAG